MLKIPTGKVIKIRYLSIADVCAGDIFHKMNLSK